MRVADVVEEQVLQEWTVLEAIAAALTKPGPVQARLEEGLDLVRARLRCLRARGDLSQEPAGAAGGGACGSAGGGLHASLVGQSEAMRQVYEAIRRVSHSPATVLLRGESGTGKELVAKAIHLESPRARGPFVRLHCAALTETLLESELFGHERGAFTGAVESRKGRFELADGGTLFLDEIGDIPPATQVKLLRVLQDRCFERVGGTRPIQVDVRVISATHRDLEALVRAGTFREDLYYRLNVVPVTLPPLRERAGDVPLLIAHFLARFNRENRRRVRLGPELLALMARYHWPGNVRELQNCVERLVVMAEPGQEWVTLERLPSSLRGYFADLWQVTQGGREPGGSEPSGGSLGQSVQALERRRLVEALAQAGWVQARAARGLGLTPRQVAYKMRKYGIREPST
ncbi:MAG: sigma 54-interacting transcriptional regulator [Nitrospirota bacterium]